MGDMPIEPFEFDEGWLDDDDSGAGLDLGWGDEGDESAAWLVEPATRLAICMECDYYRRWAKQCLKCKCFMPVKVRFPEKHCPIGKW